MAKNNWTIAMYVVELCTYNVLSVSNSIQTPRNQDFFPQVSDVFQLATCHFNFQEHQRLRKEAGERD